MSLPRIQQIVVRNTILVGSIRENETIARLPRAGPERRRPKHPNFTFYLVQTNGAYKQSRWVFDSSHRNHFDAITLNRTKKFWQVKAFDRSPFM